MQKRSKSNNNYIRYIMTKFYLSILTAFAFVQMGQAQTKVFQEVSEAISTEIAPITQNGTLIGYLSFTELEKADKDSFNYRITIMDENLNDLGVVTFKELKLALRQVSFENDMLCLSYMKSNVLGYDWKTGEEKNEALRDGWVAVFAQFISLSGNITHTFEKKVRTNVRAAWGEMENGKMGDAMIKHPLQLKNLHEKGFIMFFGDEDRNCLLVLSAQGELLWEKYITEKADHYYMLTSAHDVYLLMKTDIEQDIADFAEKQPRSYYGYLPPKPGGYTLISYDTDRKIGIFKYPLADNKNNPLQVMAFANDPVSGKPFLAGYILNPEPTKSYGSVKGISEFFYKGIFNISLNGHQKSSVKQSFTYWDNNAIQQVAANGFLSASQGYIIPNFCFRDFNGNTYFAGSNLMTKYRYLVKDAVLIKQDGNGTLAAVNTINTGRSVPIRGNVPLYWERPHSFYTVVSPESRATYLIIDDTEKAVIYNVDQQKMVRAVVHKDGDTRTYIYPAKEGHIIVGEYNSKKKLTKLSIEVI
jgi:hypothetical protein